MKTYVIIFLLSLLSCRDRNADGAPQNQLLLVTQTGGNTAGCKVDGEVVLPRGQKIQGGPVLAAQHQYINGGHYFGLHFQDIANNQLKSIGIDCANIELQEGATYELSTDLHDYTKSYSSAQYTLANSTTNNSLITYVTSNSLTGALKIIHLDLKNHIISGTFWFNAANTNGDIVHITDGRFDVYYAS